MSDPIARNIVSQLGDLYMDFTHPETTERAGFVKYRQATNDQADAFVERILAEVKAQALRDASTQVLVLGTWSGSSIHVGERASEWLRARADRIEKGAAP